MSFSGAAGDWRWCRAVDRSLVYPMSQNDRTTALVASTIALAHSLGLRMVADGVENDDAYAEVVRLGCDQAQGSYMSRPVPAAELSQWLSSRWKARQNGTEQGAR